MGLFDKLRRAPGAPPPGPADPSILRELLQPSRLTQVVDVGANPIDGDPPYKTMLARGLCRVTGFEPQPEALAELQARQGANELYLPYVVGDGAPHTLHLCASSGMTSLLPPDPRAHALFVAFAELGRVVEEVPVETRRLDDLGEVPELDFLKIDVQGAELSVFRGGRQKLAHAVAIQTEISFVTLYAGQPALGEVDLELRGQGFMPHCITTAKLWPVAPYAREEDAWKPVRQLLEADMVYVRDLSRMEAMTDAQLGHLALICEQCYGSYDVVLRCLAALQARGALAPEGLARYLGWLRAQGQAVKPP